MKPFIVGLSNVACRFVGVGPSWWGAIFTLVGAIATFCAVVTAFVLQDRQSKREIRRKREEELKIEIAAIKSCEASLAIYDSIFNPKDEPEFRYKSDTSKRLLMMKGMVDRYSNAVIHDVGLVSVVVTAQTLLAQSAEDISSLPNQSDKILFCWLQGIAEHRKELSEGLRRLIAETWKKPAFPDEAKSTPDQTRP